jgi:hypothetical protein
MDRLRESIGSRLGDDAKLTTQILYEEVVTDLLTEEDWKAKKAAWDIVMDWNEWLADLGEQHREPDKSEVDVEMETRTTEVSYTVVRGEDLDGLRAGGSDPDAGQERDYEELGFTRAPTAIELDDAEGEQ